MPENIFEKVKNAVNIVEVVERYGIKLDRNDKACCPFHNEKTPSFSVKKSENIFKCFGCGESGDAIDFVSKLKEIESLEAAKLLAEMYCIDSEPYGRIKENIKPCPKKQRQSQKTKAVLKQEIKNYITACNANITQSDYFAGRGLTAETIKRFHLGYDTQKHCVVIPYSSKLDYYQTRSVDGKDFRKPPTDKAGEEPLWGAKALEGSGAVFVVESPICAMSIEQCGGRAVSICGTGIQKLIHTVRDMTLKCVLILSLDNDSPGKTAQQELARSLFEMGKQFIVHNISADKKDPNELHISDADALKANISDAAKAAKQKFSKLKDLFRVSELQKADIPPIKWIVKGLLPEGLSLLAAPSKYGKSWMMMQLCIAVAEGKPFLEKQTVKCDVAYFSLEDSPRRFRDRSNSVTKGEFAPPGYFGMVKALSMATGLFEQLEELMDINPNTGLIIIDTFQKVRGGQMKNESVYGADYREMSAMKTFADKHRISLLLVHHLRKQDDDSDVFNRINGSMAIMGASDTSWVMSRKKRGDTNTILTVTGRDVDDAELIIAFDKPTFSWNLVGNAEEEASRRARAEYEGHPVVKTVKKLVEKNPQGWRGNCSEIKLQIYEQTGTLFDGSADTVGRTISKYLDRLSADGIVHTEERGKRHVFSKKQPTLFSYQSDD